MLFDLDAIDNVHRTVNIEGFKFNHFHIDDKPVFDDIYFSVGYDSLVWENSFSYLYAYAKSMTKNMVLLWRFVGEHLFIFEYNTKSKRISSYCNPVSKNNQGNLRHDILLCTKMMARINKTTYTSFSYFKNAVFDDIFDISAIRKNGGKKWDEYSDFIFRCSDLINLEGKKYKTRRHLVNKFKSTYPNHVVRLMTDDDFDDVIRVRNFWIKSRFDNDTKKVWDYDIFPHTLANRDVLGNRVFVIEVDGVIQGFFILARLGNNCSLVINENTNLEFEGLTEYLWYESLRRSTDLGEYENDGNGGPHGDGLYNYKMSHRPVMTIPKMGVRMNKSGDIVIKDIVKHKKKGSDIGGK